MKLTLTMLLFATTAFLGCSRNPQPLPQVAVAMPAASSAPMVRILVSDDTDRRPLAFDAEVWLTGNDPWLIVEDTQHGAARRNLSIGTLEKSRAIRVFPDGRSGIEAVIPIMVTSEMEPRGGVRDMVRIHMNDDEVWFFGTPVEAANSELMIRIARFPEEGPYLFSAEDLRELENTTEEE